MLAGVNFKHFHGALYESFATYSLLTLGVNFCYDGDYATFVRCKMAKIYSHNNFTPLRYVAFCSRVHPIHLTKSANLKIINLVC